MRIEKVERKIEIPQGIELIVQTPFVTVKGPKGEMKKRLLSKEITSERSQNQLKFILKNAKRTEKMQLGTLCAHIRNMIEGVKNGYTYRLKICSSHFPMSVVVQGNDIIIKNYLGERHPRKARILEGVKAKVEANIITLEGNDIELVGQTASNIELAAQIRDKDRRVFQDGIYIYAILKGTKQTN